MKTLFTKIGSAISGVALFGIAALMAGLGFAVIGGLALFGLMIVALAMLASPFLHIAQPITPETAEQA